MPAPQIVQLQVSPPEPQLLGLDASLWMNGLSIIISATIAVLIAVWLAPRVAEKAGRKGRQEDIVRTLLHTWQVLTDPAFHKAVALIPLEFHGCEPVLVARERFLAHVKIHSPFVLGKAERHSQTQTLAAEMIAAAAKQLGIDQTAQALLDGLSVPQGFVQREMQLREALRYGQKIAGALEESNSLLRDLLGRGRGR